MVAHFDVGVTGLPHMCGSLREFLTGKAMMITDYTIITLSRHLWALMGYPCLLITLS